MWYHRDKVVHSLWLHTAVELGFVGLLVLASLYAMTCLRAWQLFRRPPPQDAFFRDAGRMVLLSIPGFCVSATFLSIIYLEQPYYVILFAVGACKLASRAELAVDEVPILGGQGSQAAGGERTAAPVAARPDRRQLPTMAPWRSPGAIPRT
jgi:hypothetical protein